VADAGSGIIDRLPDADRSGIFPVRARYAALPRDVVVMLVSRRAHDSMGNEGTDTTRWTSSEFPSVRRDQAVAALELPRESLLTRARTA
jgi:hypothetical protein